jgi:hypothetical protein
MKTIEGGCHCGNVRYRLRWPAALEPVPARACGCSFCRSRRASYTSHREAELEAFISDETQLNRYRFATGTADFYICRLCGAMTFATSEIDGQLRAVVNVWTFDQAENMRFEVASTDFDGESVDRRLQRRARNWIPRVKISVRKD